MARADRLARIDADRIGYETDYRAALIAALETTAKGRWGLFGHQGKKSETPASKATVTALLELGETIDDLRETLGLEPFALHAEFVAARGPVRSDAVGEPKQAQAWLARLTRESTGDLQSTPWKIGIIGGSGLYAIDALENPEWRRIDTPWGALPDELLFGRIGAVELVFLPRHGRGHRISPSELNPRANIDALKRAGCTDILAISSIGSLREELEPGRFVVVDQFIDRTTQRNPSFFGTGMVAHVSMAEPVCPRLSGYAAEAVASAGGKVTQGATYLAMEAPQFSTRAESLLYRQWGADVIGMTAMPEAKLAREAELPYALIGMVTDYDCWRDEAAFVEVSEVIRQMGTNGAIARQTVAALVAALPAERAPSPLDTVLDHALITATDARDPAVLAKLDAVAGRVLRQG